MPWPGRSAAQWKFYDGVLGSHATKMNIKKIPTEAQYQEHCSQLISKILKNRGNLPRLPAESLDQFTWTFHKYCRTIELSTQSFKQL